MMTISTCVAMNFDHLLSVNIFSEEIFIRFVSHILYRYDKLIR